MLRVCYTWIVSIHAADCQVLAIRRVLEGSGRLDAEDHGALVQIAPQHDILSGGHGHHAAGRPVHHVVVDGTAYTRHLMCGILNGVWSRPWITWPVRIGGVVIDHPGSCALLAAKLKQAALSDAKGSVDVRYEAALSPVAGGQSDTLIVKVIIN